MLYYITMLILFLLLTCVCIILLKKVISFRQKNNDLQKRESEFISKLVAEWKLKPDQTFQMDNFIESQTTERTNSNLNPKDLKEKESEFISKLINEIRSLIFERVKGLSAERASQILKYLDKRPKSDRRQYDRKDLFRTIEYSVDGRYYNDFIKNISEGGLFIETFKTFSVGQEPIMIYTAPASQKPLKIHGEIIRSQTNGVGVKFKIKSQVQESVLKSFVKMIEEYPAASCRESSR